MHTVFICCSYQTFYYWKTAERDHLFYEWNESDDFDLGNNKLTEILSTYKTSAREWRTGLLIEGSVTKIVLTN